MALVEIGHLAGPELDVGAADTNPVDVDDDLPGAGDGIRDLLDRTQVRRGDHEGLH